MFAQWGMLNIDLLPISCHCPYIDLSFCSTGHCTSELESERAPSSLNVVYPFITSKSGNDWLIEDC